MPKTERLCRTWPLVAAAFLVLGVLACDLPGAEPTPTVFVPAESPGTEGMGPAVPPPQETPTEQAQGVPPAVCPPPGSPTLVQPAGLADYPPAILQYLSAGGDVTTLESTLAGWYALPQDAGAVISSDLTGDGVPEVIVALQGPSADPVLPTGDLLVLGCQDGAYALLYQHGYDPYGPTVRLLPPTDLDLDGRPDVAYTSGSCGAHTCFEMLEVLGWNGAGFVSLMGGSLDMPYPTYLLGAGRIEAQSGSIGSVGAEPQRGYAEIWEWNGSVLTITQRIWTPPVYRYHALLDGEVALLEGDYAAAAAAYTRVIDDETLQEWGAVSGGVDPAEERARLTAFAYWRFVLLDLLAGDLAAMDAHYAYLQANYPAGTPGHDTAVLAETFRTAYDASGSLTAACAQVVAAAEAAPSLQQFFNVTYGYANPWWEPVDICPFVE